MGVPKRRQKGADSPSDVAPEKPARRASTRLIKARTIATPAAPTPNSASRRSNPRRKSVIDADNRAIATEATKPSKRKRGIQPAKEEEENAPKAGLSKRTKTIDLTADNDVVVISGGTAITNEKEEKRLKRYRAAPPRANMAIHQRAMTQRMFVIERKRGGTSEWPEETVELAGTTGNIYTVHISKVPTCNCPHAIKGNQCKHIIYVLVRVLKAKPEQSIQLALLTSELRKIFANAPPIPSASSTDGNNGNRKPIEGECPICVMDFEPDKESIVYCKAACGNNIHKQCFGKWAASKKDGAELTCPYCRTPWAVEDTTELKTISKAGKPNEEGYVNVAGELGISGRRDYSTYNHFWARRHMYAGGFGRY